jgi:hypothetical protein
MEIIINVISQDRDKAREIVESIIEAEQNYLFTNDSGYKDSKTSMVGEEKPFDD